MRRHIMVSATVAALVCSGGAHAQDVALPEPTAQAPRQPAGNGDSPEQPDLELPLEGDREIDLGKVVTSAAKSLTTVQEAPSIVTIITAEEIQQRGFRQLMDALGTVPGWMETYAIGNQAPLPLVRGVQQAALLLHDGISMFDPWANLGNFGPTLPLENVKRIELVTGPGGVLWGANSFLGIINLISKDAEDVDGLEVSAGYGDGPGNVEDIKAYALFGKTFFGGKLKLFQHVSYESYVGQTFDYPQIVSQSPAPQPVGPTYLGPARTQWPNRSWLVTIDGKYTLGPLSLYYMVPVGEMHRQLTFGNIIAPNNIFNQYDRYAILEYKDRFLRDRFGIVLKGYYSQFVRDFDVQGLPVSTLFPQVTASDGKSYGGLVADLRGQLIQRAGGTFDADVNFTRNLRLLFGGELFYESVSGSNALFPSPTNASDLPFYCPVDDKGQALTACPRVFINDASRVVGALFVNGQARLFSNRLSIDGGVRLQKGWGNRPYDFTPLYSAAIVWNFVHDLYFKANYATGFRPPVFENLAPAPGGLNYGASPNLKNEHSQSFQAEINAQLLRNVHRIRELDLRLDYSYTYLENLILIRQNEYGNTGTRAIHSAELYARLYLSGDHFVQAAYTYLYSVASDVGVLRYAPNQWFTVGGSVNVVKRMLDFNINLNVFSAYEDANRYPSGPGLAVDNQHPAVNGMPGATTVENTGDLTFDRLSPVAVLQVGARLRLWKDHIRINAQVYNALNQHYYRPDAFYDITPSVEQTPIPAPGINFFTSIAYHP